MRRYLVYRIGMMIPTVLIASIILFGIMRVLPGDVATVILSGSGTSPHSVEAREALRDELGLNDPIPVQYGRWLWSMVNGDFGGRSLATGEKVRTLVGRQFSVTLLLTAYAITLSVLISIPAGVLAAVTRNRWPDYFVRVITAVGQAMPSFWVALLLMLGLLVFLRWSPPIIYVQPWQDPMDHLQMMMIPTLLLAWEYSAHVTRVTRASMIQVLSRDYVRTARGKGLSERIVVWRHAMRNALIPSTTVLGLQLGTLLGGTLILEMIFGLPGLGRGVVQAAVERDYPVVLSVSVLLVLIMLVANLFLDLLNMWLDPRVSAP
jgi:peptide/nickel transport system permease protein